MIKVISIIRLAGFAAALLSATPLSYGQAEPDIRQVESDPKTTEDEVRTLPPVHVFGGPPKWKLGIEAFNAGEYKKAEQAFRSVRNQFGSVAVTASFDVSDVFNGNPITSSIARGSGTPLGSGRIGDVGPGRDRPASSLISTSIQLGNASESYALASYAVGVSLIKQGEYSEAKRFLSNAIGYDKRLYDARTRLGLIALLQDKPARADRQLRELQRWCQSYDCDGADELGRAVRTLRTAVETYASPS